MSATATDAALPVCPAPWDLTGEGWIFPISTPFSKTPIPLPDGSYAPLETGTSADQGKRFHGGVGMVMIVRYTSDEAGPYDELMYIPGLFSRAGAENGEEPKYHLAISRIYVSTDASVANGRRNWGIPKHRAEFSFTPSTTSRGSTLLTVSHPSSPSQPFFRCLLRDSRATPFALPVSTTWLDWRISQSLMSGYEAALVQPPVPAASSTSSATLEVLKESGQNVHALVASDKTYVVEPAASGWSKLTTMEPAPEDGADEDWSGFGDGKGFPKFKLWSNKLNVHMTSFRMSFPVPEVVDGL
ncbi:hypothetical protein NBRC10512_002899 [Rhodotorula toruloides]|uniref:RHTO0S13e04654g1_1 n=2 Tax=Rhodotorula toruloides TaxID=5286 RepID=A0A061BGI1_RHOTO|nr:acetoacetate decarboxylase beta barrel domain containing protein [Rhodotorula toruloides NP11]EMS22384.1 acetoacetate decarboxylase beta barrel domain containing protein [Rhodotorula toruloides NP11]CDR47008.1 RHTO0S13e04654g1_1 [Rhodotorula toruloides]